MLIPAMMAMMGMIVLIEATVASPETIDCDAADGTEEQSLSWFPGKTTA